MSKIKSAINSVTDTADCLIGPGCIYHIPDIFKKHFPGAKVVVVADDNTNKLIVSTTDRYHEEVMQLIRDLDKRPDMGEELVVGSAASVSPEARL